TGTVMPRQGDATAVRNPTSIRRRQHLKTGERTEFEGIVSEASICTLMTCAPPTELILLFLGKCLGFPRPRSGVHCYSTQVIAAPQSRAWRSCTSHGIA